MQTSEIQRTPLPTYHAKHLGETGPYAFVNGQSILASVSASGGSTSMTGVNALAPATRASSDSAGSISSLESTTSLLLDGKCMSSAGLLTEFGVDGVWPLDTEALM